MFHPFLETNLTKSIFPFALESVINFLEINFEDCSLLFSTQTYCPKFVKRNPLSRLFLKITRSILPLNSDTLPHLELSQLKLSC